MRGSHAPLKVYAALTAAVAVLVLALGLVGWLQAPGVMGEQPLATRVVLAAALTALAMLAGLFPIEVARHVKVSVTTAAQFAAILLLGVPLGAGASAAGVAGYHVVMWARGQRSSFDLLLNTSEAIVTATIAALAAQLALRSAPPPFALPLAASVAAATMYLSNKAIIRVAVALAYRSSFWALYWAGIRSNAWQHVALFLLGFLAALNAPQYPWALLLVAFPTAIVYISFKANHQLRTQTREAVEAMADVVDMRDPYTFGHCKRVAALSTRLATRLGLPPDQIELVQSAARVHDIGKIGVPDHVLLKRGRLEPHEWAQMQQHPEIGAQLLEKFPDYAEGRELVHDHHERVDGAGYPRHLPAARVPLGARIIAAADAYDAMTTDRPYRPGLAPEQTIEELHRCRGTQWDPQVIDALITLLEEEGRLAPAPVPQAVSSHRELAPAASSP